MNSAEDLPQLVREILCGDTAMGFTIQTQASYYTEEYKATVGGRSEESIMFGLYSRGGGTSGEAEIEYLDIDGLTPRLKAFEDFWHLFPLYQPLIDIMSQTQGSRDYLPTVMIRFMKEKLGYLDLTERTPEEKDKFRTIPLPQGVQVMPMPFRPYCPFEYAVAFRYSGGKYAVEMEMYEWLKANFTKPFQLWFSSFRPYNSEDRRGVILTSEKSDAATALLKYA